MVYVVCPFTRAFSELCFLSAFLIFQNIKVVSLNWILNAEVYCSTAAQPTFDDSKRYIHCLLVQPEGGSREEAQAQDSSEPARRRQRRRGRQSSSQEEQDLGPFAPPHVWRWVSTLMLAPARDSYAAFTLLVLIPIILLKPILYLHLSRARELVRVPDELSARRSAINLRHLLAFVWNGRSRHLIALHTVPRQPLSAYLACSIILTFIALRSLTPCAAGLYICVS